MKLLHVGLHNKINKNAGDTLLFDATRRCFEHFLGPIDWSLHQLWEPFDASVANNYDGVVVGGGGLLLPDQEGATYKASGWQWNCTIEQLDAIKVPLIVFAIGMNRFRGPSWFSSLFYEHISRTIAKASFFGMRERGGIATLGSHPKISYQPCPTTCLWQLYPEVYSGLSHFQGDGAIAFNIATDRRTFRYTNLHVESCVYDAMIDRAIASRESGREIVVMSHKEGDAELSGMFTTRGIDHLHRRMWDAEPAEIIDAYTKVSIVVGMRGHAQLIPFGLRKKILSVVSHDKLKWFLEDIGREELGIDVSEPDVIRVASSGLCEFEQSMLYGITCANMRAIGDILDE